MLDLHPDQPEIKVDIKPMAYCNFVLSTVGHKGPIRIVLSQTIKADLSCVVHIEKEVSEENYIWRFQNKAKFIIFPKRVNRDSTQVWAAE